MDHFDLVVERRVNIPYVHPTESWGTPDAWRFRHNPTTGAARLTVFDYKFGHRFVEVFENMQLVDYTCGILDELGIDGFADQHITVEFVIVQPRSYHKDGPIRRWVTTATNLRGLFNKLQMAAAEALGPNPKAHVGEECRDCLGRHACEALSCASMDAVEMSKGALPMELPPSAMSLELRTLKRARALLDARITGHEGVALALIKKGVPVPFFAVEASSGREAWVKPVSEVLDMAGLMGMSLAKLQEAITPKQAIKAGIPEEIIRMYSHTPQGALKLVESNVGHARKVFSK